MSNFFTTVEYETSKYILGSFALVTALSWDSTVTKLFERVWPNKGKTLRASIAYSLILTIIVVLMVIFTIKFLPKKRDVKIDASHFTKSSQRGPA